MWQISGEREREREDAPLIISCEFKNAALKIINFCFFMCFM